MTPLRDKRRWFALVLLSLGLTLIIIDSTIVNIAFPAIRRTFNTTFVDAEWVNSIYSLVFGAALITWGKLSDQYGRRNIFVAGSFVFAAGSLGSGLAPTIGMLIFSRAAQGMGGAMMSPATLSIVSSTFQGRERAIAFGLWGGAAGGAVALGPLLGGWLISYGTSITPDSWRLAFLINVPVGLLTIVGSWWAIGGGRGITSTRRLDWPGMILASSSLSAIVFGAIEGQKYGWLEAKRVFTVGPISYPQVPPGTPIHTGTVSFIPFLFAFGVLTLIAFVLFELREERQGRDPLFELGLFRYLSFRVGLVIILIATLGEFGGVLVLPIYFQLVRGLNAFQTGVQFLPFAVTVGVAAPLAGILSRALGAKRVITIGMICEAVALFWMSRVLSVEMSFWSMLSPLMLVGVGVGLTVPQLANLIMSDVPVDKAGVVSGTNNTFRQIGAALGIAVIGAILFGSFIVQAKPLIEQSTAIGDFSARVASNPSISKEARIVGVQLNAFAGIIKQGIESTIDSNQGLDLGTDPFDTALTQVPAAMKMLFKLQGVDLDNPEVLARIKRDLAPDIAILIRELQQTLGQGFTSAGQSALLTASIFVACGAFCSLWLPNRRPSNLGEMASQGY